MKMENISGVKQLQCNCSAPASDLQLPLTEAPTLLKKIKHQLLTIAFLH